MRLIWIMRTDLAGWRVFARKCRSRGVGSNSDPRSLPSQGRHRTASSDQSRRREVTRMGTAPAFASLGEALEMVRAGLGYLASADPGQLSAATQAECLRELEQD